jgi:hypothetical protein
LGTFHTGDTKLFQGYLDHARDSGVDEMVVVPWDPDRATEEVIPEIGKLAGI